MANSADEPHPIAPQKGRLTGLAGFTLVWAGQLISVLASNMSNFALSIWAFQQTGSATVLGLMQTFFILPHLLISPFAGAMVDRYNRKLMMMVSDLTAVLATFGILFLNTTGRLQIWQLYVASVIFGLGSSFQWPAYMAAITTMIPKAQYGRANGMMMLIETGPGVFSPILAGAVLPIIGLTGILSMDVITFFLAIAALLLVAVPQPVRSADGRSGEGTLLQEALFGFKYIFSHRSLLFLQLAALGMNLAGGFAEPVLTPMILLRSGNDSAILGSVLSVGAVGGVAGGLIMSAWGGFRRRIYGVLLGWGIFGVFGLVLFGLGQNLWAWLPFMFIGYMSFPLAQSSFNAIWQAKVAPDIQGRVFSARRMIALLADPLMPVVAGSLADHVTEPVMASQSPLTQAFGWMVGTGPGSGMALQFLLAGVLYLLILLFSATHPAIREVEKRMPDHDTTAPALE